MYIWLVNLSKEKPPIFSDGRIIMDERLYVLYHTLKRLSVYMNNITIQS